MNLHKNLRLVILVNSFSRFVHSRGDECGQVEAKVALHHLTSIVMENNKENQPIVMKRCRNRTSTLSFLYASMIQIIVSLWLSRERKSMSVLTFKPTTPLYELNYLARSTWKPLISFNFCIRCSQYKVSYSSFFKK